MPRDLFAEQPKDLLVDNPPRDLFADPSIIPLQSAHQQTTPVTRPGPSLFPAHEPTEAPPPGLPSIVATPEMLPSKEEFLAQRPSEIKAPVESTFPEVGKWGQAWFQAVTGQIPVEEFQFIEKQTGMEDVVNKMSQLSGIAAGLIYGKQIGKAGLDIIRMANSEFRDLSKITKTLGKGIDFGKEVVKRLRGQQAVSEEAQVVLSKFLNGTFTPTDLRTLKKSNPSLFEEVRKIIPGMEPEIKGLLPAPVPKSFARQALDILKEERASIPLGDLPEPIRKQLQKADTDTITLLMKSIAKGLTPPSGFEAAAQAIKKIISQPPTVKSDTSPEVELQAAVTTEANNVLADKGIPLSTPTVTPVRGGEVKKRVRDVTGQAKVGELLYDERTALKILLKREQKVARDAFRMGREAGVDIQKTHQERIAKAKAKRETLKTEINQIVSRINKQPTENLPLDYKKRISEVASGFDLKKRTAKTLAKRQALKAFIKRQQAAGEPINIPDKSLNVLDKTTLNSMTVEDLRNIGDIIQQLAHVGRTKAKLLKIQGKRELNRVITDLKIPLEKSRKYGEVPPGVPVTEQTKKQYLPGKVKTAVSEFFDKNMRVERILERLDGYEENGPNYSIIYKPIEEAANTSYAGQSKKTEAIENVTKQLGLKPHKLATEVRKVNDRLSLTGEQMMEVAISVFDKDKLRHLKMGNGFTDQDIKDTLKAMTPEERAFIKWELDNYWRPQYAEINQVYEQLFNNSLPQIDGYSSIQVDFDTADLSSFETDIAQELLGRSQVRTAYVERGFTKERQRGSIAPLSLKHFDNLFRNIEKVEHFKAFGLTARDLRKVINHPSYKKAVTQSAGPGTYKIINEWFGDVISRRANRVDTPASKMIKLARNHSAVAMLGFNALTGMKQVGSSLNAAALTGAPAVLNGMQQFIQHPGKLQDFVYKRSPQLKNRAVERDIQELLRQAKASKVLSGKATLSSASMKMIREMDKFTVVSVWKGAYDQALKRGQAEQEAIEYADQVIRRTQPAFDIKDLPAFFRGGELEKMLTMFQNQRNQNWNFLVHDIFGKAKAGKIGKAEAFRRLLWWLSPALILGAVSRGRIKTSKEEIEKDLAKYPLLGVFLIGSLVDSMLSHWDWSLPVFQPIKEIMWTVKGKRPTTKIKHGIKTLGYAAGIPVNQPFRTGTGIVDLLNGRTNDLRRLLWSEYSLREPKPKKKRRIVP